MDLFLACRHNEWPNIQKLRKQQAGGDCADLKTTSFAATIDGGWPAAIVLALHDTPEVCLVAEEQPGNSQLAIMSRHIKQISCACRVQEAC